MVSYLTHGDDVKWRGGWGVERKERGVGGRGKGVGERG